MAQLNYHHLRYFREVAVEGHLGRAAARLNVSQSALSMQIRTLEDRLGHALFDRVGRSLQLTEAGRIALDHADRIFTAGDDLLDVLKQNSAVRPPLRVGALSTLSRNFQMQFLGPLLNDGAYGVVLKSGNTNGLLHDLEALALDVVLTTELPSADAQSRFAARRIADQTVGAHAVPALLQHSTLPALLAEAPLILPTDSVIRTGVETLLSRYDIRPTIAAEVDDMAMIRLLARAGVGVAIAPAVVLADEIAQGLIATAPFDLDIVEPFFAVTLPRKFPHPALKGLLEGHGVDASPTNGSDVAQ